MKNKCDHQCSGNCRRVGCNCLCGEWHETPTEEWEKEFAKLIPESVDILHEIKTDRIFCSRPAVVNFIRSLLTSIITRYKEELLELETGK